MQKSHASRIAGQLKRWSAGWASLSPAQHDVILIALSTAATWYAIESTETCTRLFAWIAANPEYEVDSVILAIVQSTIGIAVFASRRYIELRRASAARRLAEGQVHELAYHDMLTGLPNRRALNEQLALLPAGNSGQCMALIFVDLDRFKSVNDLHGHTTGDRLLRLAAERMREELGEGRTVYRLGGDEFAVLVELRGAHDDAAHVAARHIVEHMAEPFNDGGLVHHIGASAGISVYPADASDGDALVRAADVALYRAKHAGRGRYRSFELAMDAQIKQRALLEQQMREGIALGAFVPYYQPLIDLQTGRTNGFELLARWNRAEDEPIGPEQFIPIAEECGLIGDLLLGLLDRACVDARYWDPSLTIAINISPVQLKDPWLSEKILAVLANHGFPAQRISIEITENAIIADEENARRTILSLKNQGMRIGLDDFGTGYSSLHHLRLLPFDKIKIDKSFVSQIAEDPEALKLVKAILGLAQSLDLPVIAEGIESPVVAGMLKALGCAQGQGYLFGRAMPAAAISRALKSAAPSDWLHDTRSDADGDGAARRVA